MGERKGTNHYYPPDYDPTKGGLNKFLGTHALRERARKLHLGILIIRFEMPYNIWCDGCGNHIGMGVRYNAEKTKVGMYYSTPVYQFRMKCHLCDNHFEIKTDPGNLDYVIVTGARRQENRWDPTQNGQVVPDDKRVQKRLFDDAMFKLEHGEKGKETAKSVSSTLSQLAMLREEQWRDDYTANCVLREKFRRKRKELKAKEELDKTLLVKSSLNIALLPETDEDRKMASLLSLPPSRSITEREHITRLEIINRPALPSCSGNTTTFMGVRAAKHLERNISRNHLGILTKSSEPQSKRFKSHSSDQNGGGQSDRHEDNREELEGDSVNSDDEEKNEPSLESTSTPTVCTETCDNDISHKYSNGFENDSPVDSKETPEYSESFSKHTSLVSGDYDFSSSEESP